jgi:hypothetical protein
MESTYRHSINELVTRYRFHPELRDLYVEGERDITIFSWFVSRLAENRAVVYHINTVEIAPDARQAIGVSEGGNKGRAIALALILDRALPQECRSVFCVVDKDFHEFGFALPVSRYLIYTDFACIECYAVSANALSKLFAVYLGKTLTVTEIDSMVEVLNYVFSMRLAKRQLAPKATWFNHFTRCCSIKDGRVYLEKSALLKRVLSAAAGELTAEAVESEIQQFSTHPIEDGRQAMHGHDIIQLISWIAREKGVGNEIAGPAPLQRAVLLGLVEIEDLAKEPLFSKIAEWACEIPYGP